MNIRIVCPLLLTMVLGIGLGTGSAFASRPTGEQLSGVLNAVHKDGYIVVAGRSFHVKSDSPAAGTLASLAPGSKVTVTLDGPLGNSVSQVINISVLSDTN